MPNSKYINLSIDNQPLDVSQLDQIPITISFKFEDTEDFQKKVSGDSFDIVVPATVNNDQVANTFHNPGIEDMTNGKIFSNLRSAVLECNSSELLVGKCFLKQATHNRKPIDYTFDVYGDNADWLIDLKEATFFDFWKNISIVFTKDEIINSWAFDGTDEAKPYVFAPIRYGPKMGDLDNNVIPEYLKPSMSVYWLIYEGFKSLGYRVQSDFFDTNYFRRLVMPWTFGNFLYSEGTAQAELSFNAKNTSATTFYNPYNGAIDVKASNDNILPGFDTNNVYAYTPLDGEMTWTYLTSHSFGPIGATFEFNYSGTVGCIGPANSLAQLRWFKNGIEDMSKRTQLYSYGALSGELPTYDLIGDYFQGFNVSPGDTITAQIYVLLAASGFGKSFLQINDLSFTLSFTKYILGSTVAFNTLLGLKNYNFLDFLRGVVDTFNLIPVTDSVSKIVYFEPAHPYSLNADNTGATGGFFNGKYVDWNNKQDLSKVSAISLYSDLEREQVFKFKDDANDGVLKVVQDRNKVTLGQATYVLPTRFKADSKNVENRFFSPVMHYNALQWQAITGTAPQLICLIPDNISNTSESAAQNTFNPKLAWYAGYATAGWTFDSSNYSYIPYVFAVDYLPGGEANPVLSYSDEKIKHPVAGYAIGFGLLRRFYLQRMAIIRNGQYYDTWLKLNNFDVANQFHREHKIIRGQRWQMAEIKEYKPLTDETTAVSLKKWTPIIDIDFNSVFPSPASIIYDNTIGSNFDTIYKPLLCLTTDIPNL